VILFSSRTPSDFTPDPTHTRLSVLKGVCDLTVSNPTVVGLEYPHGVLGQALAEAMTSSYRADALGLLSTREFLCTHMLRRTEPAHVLCTSSTSESYAYALKVLCNPGDAVAVGVPGYPLVPVLASLESVRCVFFRYVYAYGRWRLDMQSVWDALKQGVKALVLVEPNNPLGVFLDAEEKRCIEQACVQYGCALVVDEVFAMYRFETQPCVPVWDFTNMPLVCVLDGVSKRLGLPQVKLGWMSVYGEPVRVAQAMERLAWVADAYLSVGQPVQAALPKLWDAGQQVYAQVLQRVQNHRRALVEMLKKNTCVDVLCAQAGWVSVLRVPHVMDSESWVCALAENHGVCVQHGGLYGFESEGFLVVSMLPQPAVFEEGMKRLSVGLECVLEQHV
jgi:alanine-synthesizing transaminase